MMSKRVSGLLIALLTLVFLGGRGMAAEEAGRVLFVDSQRSGLIFEMEFSSFKARDRLSSQGIIQEIEMAGLGMISELGRPLLPFKGTLIEIPPTGKVTIEVLDVETEDYPNFFVPVSPEYEIREDEAGFSRREKGTVYSSSLPSSEFYPAAVAEVGFTGFIRDRRVAQLKIYPFQYSQATNVLRHHRRVLVNVRFEHAADRDVNKPADPFFDSLFQDVILNFQEKPFVSSANITHLASSSYSFTSRPSDYKILVSETGLYEITYNDLVNVGISPASVDAKTLKIFCQGKEISMYVSSQGASFGQSDYILFYARGLNTEYTDANVYWLSWGGNLGKRMAEVDGTPNSEPLLGSYYRTEHFEENTEYWIPMPYGMGKDHWFWARINAGEKKSYLFNLNRPVSSANPGEIKVTVFGRTSIGANPDHHVKVYVNGTYLGEGYFDGHAEYECAVPVDQALLILGTNTLDVELVNDTGVPNSIYLNYFEVGYYDEFSASNNILSFGANTAGGRKVQVTNFSQDSVRIFEITDHDNVRRVINVPVEIAGGTGAYQSSAYSSRPFSRQKLNYRSQKSVQSSFNAVFSGNFIGNEKFLALAESAVKSTTITHVTSPAITQNKRVDYIIITHDDFASEAQFLANYRERDGFRVEVVRTGDIYDAFSFGVEHPQAIKDFLAFAYQNWGMPSFVLFLGDATADPRDYMGTGRKNYVPSFLENVGGDLGYQVPSDNWYFCVSGGSDVLPDFFGGRLTVKSREEARGILHKIRVHETLLLGMNRSDWSPVENRVGRKLNRERYSRVPNLATKQALFLADNDEPEFTELNDELAQDYFPPDFTKIKVYLQNYSNVDDATNEIINSIDQGVLTVTYVGHGSYDNWSGENLFLASDVDSLNNFKFPFILSLSCLNGYFAGWPRQLWGRVIDDCLAEKLVNASNKGAIACFAPSGLGYTWEHALMSTNLYQGLFQSDRARIGQMAMAAKINAYVHGATPDLVQTYTLFGDPACVFTIIQE